MNIGARKLEKRMGRNHDICVREILVIERAYTEKIYKVKKIYKKK